MSELSMEMLEREIGELCTVEMEVVREKLASFPEHSFSPQYEKRKQRLLHNSFSWHLAVVCNRVGKRVAAILLCLMIAGMTTVLSVDALRDGLFKLVEKIYSRFSILTFTPIDPQYTLPTVFEKYQMLYVPAGFQLQEEYSNDKTFSLFRTYTSDQKTLYFDQGPAAQSAIVFDTEGTETQTVEYEGREFLVCSNKGCQYVFWTDSDYYFLIHGELPLEELLKAAVSVQKHP